MNLKALKKWLVVWKVRLSYANSYFGVTGMAILVTQTLQDKLLKIGYEISYFALFSVLVVIGVTLAWALDHFGVYEEELNYGTEKSTLLHKLVKEAKDERN